MAISADILTLQPIAAPVAPLPLRQAPVSAVSDREGTANERRGKSKDERANVAFRSFLNAATFAGLAQTLSREAPKSEAAEEPARKTQRATKQRDSKEPVVISAEESESLYRAARAETKPAETKPAESPRTNARAPEFLAATTRYAKSFFSVSGTFARPGESLELTA